MTPDPVWTGARGLKSPASDTPARLRDRIRRWATTRPQAEAAVGPRGRLTYAELAEAVDELAGGLMAAGVERGDRVATLAQPSPEFLVTFLATAAIGGIWVGLNPRYAEPELDALVARIAPRVVLCASEIEGRAYGAWAGRLGPQILAVSLDDEATDGLRPWGALLAAGLGGEAVELRSDATAPEDPCLMVFTSGSTGAPKGALISQAALVGASDVQLRAWPADPLRVLDNLPINHIGCVGDLACYALVGGGAVIFTPRFDPAASLAAIQAEKVTVWGQVPTMFQLTLDAPGFDPAALRSLQLIFWGGAHAAPELVARLVGLAPRLATSYGQTETVGSVTFTPPDASLGQLAGTVGRAVAPYAVRIVGLDGHPAAPGGEGEVEVRTPFGMSGYWDGSTAAPASMNPDGWRRSGDIGALTPEGDLRLIGRVHDVFKSGGYNIYPAEIEAALADHPAIDAAAVVGAPDPLYGAAAVAFLVAAGEAPDEDVLRAHLRGRLANYKVPKRFVFLDALPRLPVGKVDKAALRALAGA